MTAEIAILNRSALALAADSAVTISVSNRTKVYDTAEKLFELSRTQPIALMIYNNVEFVGVPLDVLIRKFRAEKAKNVSYKRISDVADDFLDYMSKFDHHVVEEKRYLYSIIKVSFERLNNTLSMTMRNAIEELSKGGSPANLPQPDVELRTIVEAETLRHKNNPLKGFLHRVSRRQFADRFGDVVSRAADDCFPRFSNHDELLIALTELAFWIMKSAEGSDMLTGLVFGGFGEDDMFPTLRYLEIDGTFFGKVKVLSCNEVDIDRMKTRAAVVPFAQKEMVERFMYGLDAELQDEISGFVRTALNEVIDTVGGATPDSLRDTVRQKINNKLQEMMHKLKEDSRQSLLDVVYFMSKKELADIAHALVELTSQKRRFSTDEQSVGGPIDVAILTKSEGLVWIRRKHYFGTDLNQGYVSRVLEGIGGKNGRKEAV